MACSTYRENQLNNIRSLNPEELADFMEHIAHCKTCSNQYKQESGNLSTASIEMQAKEIHHVRA